MIFFSAEAILASSTSKFGIEIPRIDNEDLNSSTESTNSTSLIHCIASAGNANKYIHRSWILSSSKQTSLVWGICQSEDPKSAVVVGLPHNSLKSLLHWRWLNFWLTVQTGISDLDLVFAFHFSPLWMNEAALPLTYSIDSILEDKELMKMHVDLQKRFPINHVSQMLGGPSLRVDDTKECLDAHVFSRFLHAFHRLRFAVEWWLLSAWVRTPDLRAPVRTRVQILLLGRKSTFAVRQREWSSVWKSGPTRSSDACWESWQQHQKCLRGQEC